MGLEKTKRIAETHCAVLKNARYVSVVGYPDEAETVVVPSSYAGKPIKEIVDGAFHFCEGMRRVEIADGVQYIRAGAFTDCEDLVDVSIGKGVKRLEPYAFYDCTQLSNVQVAEGNAAYRDVDGNVYTQDGKALVYYASGKMDETFAVPDGVEQIKTGAFRGCEHLKSVVIPKGVRIVEAYAFSGCEGLKIVCKAARKPLFWSKQWNPDACLVTWEK
jgi:hypothetical protein